MTNKTSFKINQILKCMAFIDIITKSTIFLHDELVMVEV